MLNIYAILTSHNRRESTLECLRSLEASAKLTKVNLKAVLVDDASTDGTTDAVEEDFVWVKVIRGDGNLFWNRGMYLGFAEAMRQGADAYLWVNDDTHIVDDALLRIIKTEQELEKVIGKPVVVSGAMADKDTGKITYGGDVAQSWLRRFTYRKVWDEYQPLECHVAQGNFLLIPNSIAHIVGNLDSEFEHAMGDIDYSLRVRKAGFRVFVAAGVMGYCSKNSIEGTFNDSSLSFSQRWKAILHRKGLPPRSWLHFTLRHGGFMWPLYFAWPYMRIMVSTILKALKRG